MPMCQAACAGLLPTSTLKPSPFNQVGVPALGCPCYEFSGVSGEDRQLFILGVPHSLRFKNGSLYKSTTRNNYQMQLKSVEPPDIQLCKGYSTFVPFIFERAGNTQSSCDLSSSITSLCDRTESLEHAVAEGWS